MENSVGFVTYMLRCRDGSYYTGYARNAENRLAVHNAGKGAKYTRSRLPVELVYTESYESKTEAMRREVMLKRMTHAQKERLIKGLPQTPES
ncbi:MAG: GIY-YIG nuclease family protein [Eubacteriales bacterium]|nr:GIY-YIG nuclease family protein [Eubacteriales bacterium]